MEMQKLMEIYTDKILKIYDYAEVFDDALIYGNAKVYGHAKVHGRVRIYAEAEVGGNLVCFGHAQFTDDITVTGIFHGRESTWREEVISENINEEDIKVIVYDDSGKFENNEVIEYVKFKDGDHDICEEYDDVEEYLYDDPEDRDYRIDTDYERYIEGIKF